MTAAEGSLRFAVRRDGVELGEVALPLRGVHNVRNALGAIALADTLGAPFEASVEALARFGGVARRFDVRGRHDGITLVDDYAHLPSEIAAVLDAAGTSGDGWSRIVAVFQPNRYNRMAVMSPDYRDAFEAADVAVITDIYPSGQAPLPGVTGKLVVDAVCDAHPDQRVVWLPKRGELVSFLVQELRAGDVCISMGCGDVAALPGRGARRTAAAERAMSAAGGPVAAAIDLAAEVLGPLAERDVPIGPLTTYRVGGAAALLARVDDPADLAAVGRAVAASGLPVLIVGRGSNLLVADRGFAGLAIVLGPWAHEIAVDGTTVTAGGAVSLPVLARQTVGRRPDRAGVGGRRAGVGRWRRAHERRWARLGHRVVAGGGPRVRPAQRRGLWGAGTRAGPAFQGVRPR